MNTASIKTSVLFYGATVETSIDWR